MIKIFTYAFNNPKYLEYQIKAFKKFMTEPYDFCCVDNAIASDIRHQLRQISINNGIRYQINQKPDHSLHGLSHYSALQWSYNTLMVNQQDTCVMVDHDMFPIHPISISELLDGALIAGAPQSRYHVQYLHPSLMVFKMGELPNKETISFYGGKIDDLNVDIGGELHYYFTKNPGVKVRFLPSYLINEANQNMHIIPSELHQFYNRDYLFEIVDNKFLHTRLGSNWIYIEKSEFIKRDNLIYSTLDKYIG